MDRSDKKIQTTLEIRKYPNRRYYDATHSRHLSLEQIHRLIHEGNDIRVVDAKSGDDITIKVLTQILLEYEPVKLGLFSSELLIRAIRVKDRMLADFVDLYFRQAFEAFCHSRSQFERALTDTHQLSSSFVHPLSWAGNFLPSWFSQETRADPQLAAPPTTGNANEEDGATGELRDELAALKKEVSSLREEIESAASTRKRPAERKTRE
jgi:polyhydroxyalkanoate synthesis repressor PhaR